MGEKSSFLSCFPPFSILLFKFPAAYALLYMVEARDNTHDMMLG
jgi:hypothetical protein